MRSTGNEAEPSESSASLLDIYKIHVDEYRYNVSLTWERTKFLLTLNSTLTVAGLTLFRFADEYLEFLFLATIFLLTILTSWLSIRVAVVGKVYYRNSRYVLKKAEQAIGLHTVNTAINGLGLASTETMADIDHVLNNPHGQKIKGAPSITRLLRVIFIVLMVINSGGMVISIYNGWQVWIDPIEDPYSEYRIVPA